MVLVRQGNPVSFRKDDTILARERSCHGEAKFDLVHSSRTQHLQTIFVEALYLPLLEVDGPEKGPKCLF